MDLDHYEEDNPNLDGDYKAVLKRRRELAATRQIEPSSTVTNQLATPSATVPEQEPVDVRLQVIQQTRDSLFGAVEAGDTDLVSSLISKTRQLSISLSDDSMRKDYDTCKEQTVLHRALVNQSDKVADLLIAAGGQELVLAQFLNEIDENVSQKTCLHIVSETQHGSVKMAKKLLSTISKEADKKDFLYKNTLVLPDGQRARNLMCLHLAAKNGKTDLVSYYINDCQMSVNLKNNKNDTPLLWASNEGHVEVVELLISLGAKVDEQNDKGTSALHWAARGRYPDVVKALLEKGKANVNIRRKLGLVCPLVMASAMGFDDVVQVLIAHHVDVNTRIHNQETALHYAAGEGATDVCLTLIKAGAILNAADGKGDTPILEAAVHGHVNTVVALIRNGADIQSPNFDRQTVWDHAINSDGEKMLKALLDNSEYWQPTSIQGDGGRTTSARSVKTRAIIFPKGITPVHIASQKGDIQKISILLDAGINPLCKDKSGNTFIHIAASHNQLEILSQYIDESKAAAINDDGNTPLHLACKHGNADAIEILVKKSKLQAANKSGLTCLHEAAKCKHIQTLSVELLVTQVIQSHDWTLLDAQDKGGNTALHLAVMAGNVEVVHALKALSIKLTNKDGNTPLHLAVKKKEEAIFLQLLEDHVAFGKDADLNVQNAEKKSLFSFAVEYKHLNILQHIISAGGDVAIKGDGGNTVLHHLASLMMDDTNNQPIYMKMVKEITGKAFVWWSVREKLPLPHEDTVEHHEANNQANAKLFLETVNDDRLNVLQYAATIGCASMVQHILNIPHVFRHRNPDKPDKPKYDVTNLTPATALEGNRHRKVKSNATSPSINSKLDLTEIGDRSGVTVLVHEIDKDEEPRKESLIELIVSNDNTAAAASVLDVEPVASVVSHYWATYQWLFGFMMVAHLVHMSLLSGYGPLLMEVSRHGCTNNSILPNNGFNAQCSLDVVHKVTAIECLLLVMPTGLVLFEIFNGVSAIMYALSSVTKPFRNIDMDGVLGPFLLRICGLIMAVTTIAWYALYRLTMLDQDYVLATALVFGWIYTLHFTRGFQTIHHFNLMLRHMIFKDVAKCLVFFSFILLGFGFAQYTMIRLDTEYSMLTVADTLFVCFQWLIGMGNFWNKPADSFLMYRYAFISVLFIIYCVISAIVLMNLLIATMSDSYSEVRNASALFWKVNSIQMAIDIEKLVPSFTRALRKIRVRSSNLDYDANSKKWFISIRVKDTTSVGASDTEIKDIVSSLDQKMTSMQNDITSLKLTVEQLSLQVHENRPKLLKTLGVALAGLQQTGLAIAKS